MHGVLIGLSEFGNDRLRELVLLICRRRQNFKKRSPKKQPIRIVLLISSRWQHEKKNKCARVI